MSEECPDSFCPMPFDAFEKLALGFLNSDLTPDERFEFINVLGLAPSLSRHKVARSALRGTRLESHLEPIMHGFMIDCMTGHQYEYLMVRVLGFDPWDLHGEENVKRIRILYEETAFRYFLCTLELEYRCRR